MKKGSSLLQIVAVLINGLWPLFCTGAPVISEFMAINDTVLPDEDSVFSDWIEIYNPAASPTNLNGWHLTDDADNPTRWTFPNVNLRAGEYLIVFASGKDRTAVATNLHTNFKLSGDGEYLALFPPGGTNASSEFTPAFPPQYPDVSYGIQTSGTNPTLRAGQPGYLIYHTPGTANTMIPAPHPLYSDHSLARIDLTISQADWDALMNDPYDATERHVTVQFQHGDIDRTVSNAGIRCRGNTSLVHMPRSFRISFDAFVPGQDLFGIEKLKLVSEVNDPSMARSKLVCDISNAAGLPSGYANHAAMVIHGPDYHRGSFEGSPFFDSVLINIQSVDDVFLEQRYGSKEGNLYKCNFRDGVAADLTYRGPDGSSYSVISNTYELKYAGAGDNSYNDLAAFIDVINHTTDEDFPTRIKQVFEVDAYLKRMAVDVLTGNWDDHWTLANNTYLYRHPGTGRWILIPYDFDNSFGIRWIGSDWGIQNIYSWGDMNPATRPLPARLLSVPEFRNRYSYYLKIIADTYANSNRLAPLAHHVRETLVASLSGTSITNVKARDRERYQGDWPHWNYLNFYYSLDYAQDQEAWGGVPNKYGVTKFPATRNASALSQLHLTNIAPIISSLALTPSLPRVGDDIEVAATVKDDGDAIATVLLHYAFTGGAGVTNTLTLTNTSPDTYSGKLSAFAESGILSCYLSASDTNGAICYEPFGGSNYAMSLELGSPALDLKISEINYHPYDPTQNEIAEGFTDSEDFEFIEMYNSGDHALDLNGFQFTDGISYTFPSYILPAKCYVLAVKDPDAFLFRCGSHSNLVGSYSGKLSNGGETLRLEDSLGNVIEEFTYDDESPWPLRADGAGSSLERIRASVEAAYPTNWRASAEYGGSPGTNGFGPRTDIVINEILTRPGVGACDAIELRNRTEGAINIGYWYLSNTNSDYRKYRIPENTIIPASGYTTFWATNSFYADTNNPGYFNLDGIHGGGLWLMQADENSNLTCFADDASYDAAKEGESFGRWPDGSGALYPMLTTTLNSVNSGPRVGPLVISEIMYHPKSENDDLEYIEICNPTTGAIDLTGWAFDSGIQFAFTNGASINPDDVLVVVPFSPTNTLLANQFHTAYGMSAAISLHGGYDGKLANEGEVVRLMRAGNPPPEEPAYTPMLIEDMADYDDHEPWPSAPDGSGPSLMRIGPDAWGNDPASWCSANIGGTPGRHPLADSNGDGIPDVWTIETFGGTNVPGSQANEDYDNDRSSNKEEYGFGTCATNAASVVDITINWESEGTIRLSFPSQTATGAGYFDLERRYKLEHSSAVTGAWETLSGQDNIPAVNGTIVRTNLPDQAIGLFRVATELE